MGNCVHGGGGEKVSKAAVVEYPSGRHELVVGGRVTAHQVMLKNPGFYVAKKSPPPSTATRRRRCLNASPLRSPARPTPSLLPADAPLCTGAHYRLLTFEEVFYQFARANRMEFRCSPKLRSSRRMQQPTNSNKTKSKRNCILPFSDHSRSAPSNKKGKASTSPHKHPSYKSYF